MTSVLDRCLVTSSVESLFVLSSTGEICNSECQTLKSNDIQDRKNYSFVTTLKKMTGETPRVRSDKKKPREDRQIDRYHKYHGSHR